MTALRVAAVQLRSTQNREENLARARGLMEEAAKAGAKLIALPENLSFMGHDRDKVALAEDLEDGPTVEMLRSFAAEHATVIVGGSVPLSGKDPKKVTNTCLAIDENGTIVARYDKMHLFDVAIDAEHTFTESKTIENGSEVVTTPLLGRTAGFTICYDLRFPELFRSLALEGAEVIFVPAAFTRETGQHHWEVLLRARAIENLCFIVAPAQWGEHGAGRVSFGNTMIIDPWGEVIARCADGEGIAVADLEFDRVAEARARLPSLSHMKVRSL